MVHVVFGEAAQYQALSLQKTQGASQSNPHSPSRFLACSRAHATALGRVPSSR